VELLPVHLIVTVTVAVALADDDGSRVPKGTVCACEPNVQDNARHVPVPMRVKINTIPDIINLFIFQTLTTFYVVI
jgi:hypothetical protein